MRFDPAFRDDVCTDLLWRQAMQPLSLPLPGQYGSLSVVQKATYRIPLYQDCLVFSSPLALTLLYEGATLWMSDTPQERLMMLAGANGMYGHVLVAGGGLGIYVQYLCQQGAVNRITVVERHADIVEMLGSVWESDPRVEIVHAPFEEFVQHSLSKAGLFDCCYVDIHPTIDPQWLPRLNWLRDRCTASVTGRLRVWGYHWMVRALVEGLEQGYIPLLRRGVSIDTPLGRNIEGALPRGWRGWSSEVLHDWLVGYGHRVAWR